MDSELFDWQHKEREIDPVPTFVRPGKPESPVDINFDHSQAALGEDCHCITVLSVVMGGVFGYRSGSIKGRRVETDEVGDER